MRTFLNIFKPMKFFLVCLCIKFSISISQTIVGKYEGCVPAEFPVYSVNLLIKENSEFKYVMVIENGFANTFDGRWKQRGKYVLFKKGPKQKPFYKKIKVVKVTGNHDASLETGKIKIIPYLITPTDTVLQRFSSITLDGKKYLMEEDSVMAHLPDSSVNLKIESPFSQVEYRLKFQKEFNRFKIFIWEPLVETGLMDKPPFRKLLYSNKTKTLYDKNRKCQFKRE